MLMQMLNHKPCPVQACLAPHLHLLGLNKPAIYCSLLPQPLPNSAFTNLMLSLTCGGKDRVWWEPVDVDLPSYYILITDIQDSDILRIRQELGLVDGSLGC